MGAAMTWSTVTNPTSGLNVKAPNTRNNMPTVVRTVDATHAPTSTNNPRHPDLALEFFSSPISGIQNTGEDEDSLWPPR